MSTEHTKAPPPKPPWHSSVNKHSHRGGVSHCVGDPGPVLKMSSKLLDSMTGTLRCDYNDNNIIMIRIITVIIIPIATISSLLSILQTLACSLISMLL